MIDGISILWREFDDTGAGAGAISSVELFNTEETGAYTTVLFPLLYIDVFGSAVISIIDFN